MIFVDSGAWFALVVSTDPDHAAATAWLAQNQQPLLTTDYVLDETLTLLRKRGQKQKAIALGASLWSQAAATLHYLTHSELLKAWDIFQRFADKDWSFTDCTSRAVMEELHITTAFAFDHHFRQFGTVAVLP